MCQRSARFDHYVYIRTVHGGYHLLPDEMLFDLEADPHEQHNLAQERPDLCAKGAKLILDWNDAMMKTSAYDADPMWTVMREQDRALQGTSAGLYGKAEGYAQGIWDELPDGKI